MKTHEQHDLLGGIVSQAERLLASLPISKDAYKAWESSADSVLEQCFGAGSAAARNVRSIGAMPTTFHESSMAKIQARLDAERKERLTIMMAAVKKLMGPSQGEAVHADATTKPAEPLKT